MARALRAWAIKGRKKRGSITCRTQSVGQVMDPRFFLPCFHGPRASRLGHKKEPTQNKNSRNSFRVSFHGLILKALKLFNAET